MSGRDGAVTRAAELLAAALLYARLGWFVFPVYEVRPGPHTPLECTCPPWSRTRKAGVCGNAGKHPRTANGLNDASRDPATIRAWWCRRLLANVGIATGPSGLVVVDVDPRNDGDESLRALEAEHGALPLTPLAHTGGGGEHHVLARPDDMARVPNFSLAQGIDVKCDGGYIVAPPSLHYSGRHYACDLTASFEDTPRAAAPAWLRTRLEAEVAKHTGARGPVTGAVTDGLLGKAFQLAGWLGGGLGPEKNAARCPWADQHTGGTDLDGSTVIFAPSGGRLGHWHCSHAHCAGRSRDDVLAAVPALAVAQARERLGLTDARSEPPPLAPGTFTLRPAASPPAEAFASLCRRDPRFAATWRGERPDLTSAGAELALAGRAARDGWSDQEVCDLLAAHARRRGATLRAAYVARTLALVRVRTPVQAERASA